MAEAIDMPYPKYRCPTCGKDLPLDDARITVTCAEHQREEVLTFTVREAKASDRRAVEEICDRALGETDVDVFGATFDVLAGVNLIAVDEDGALAGLLSTAVLGGELAIVLLSVYPEHQGHGVGAALIAAANDHAASRGLPAIRVATTNDDIPLLYFYQRHGFIISEVAVGAVADQLGSVVSGFSGIPIRDEIRLRRAVCSR